MKVTNWIGTCNIGRSATFAVRKTAMQRCHDQVPGCNWGWQEIDAADVGNEHAALANIFPSYSFANWPGQDVVAFSGGWHIDNVDIEIGHPGIGGVTPEAKIVTCIVCQKSSGISYTHIDSHPIHGAWKAGAPPLHLQYWNEWFAKLKDKVAQRVGRGETVMFTADTNWPNLPKIHPNDVRLAKGVLDYVIGVAPTHPLIRFSSSGTRTVALDIDGHAAHAAHVTFTEVA